LDAIALFAGQRFVAIILGEGDEEIGVIAIGRIDEIGRELIGGGARRAAHGNGEIVIDEIGAILRLQMLLQAAHSFGVGIRPIVELEEALRATRAANEAL
jgi:hypothetical protein